jgi:hypothetical protein
MMNKLLEVNMCPDFVEDRGHAFGHEPSDQDKSGANQIHEILLTAWTARPPLARAGARCAGIFSLGEGRSS